MPNYHRKMIPVGTDVVVAARQRIKNIFSNHRPISLSFSSGKDSLCLEHLTYELCLSGEIDRSKLTVNFFDEEAIYPCIERIVKASRMKWLSIGVKFNWYAMEYKHFNCLNSLVQDETFVCFDRTKKDRWIRRPPDFAIRTHPMLIPGKDSYQSWSDKVFSGFINMIAVRANESIQRAQYMSKARIEKTNKAYPIYDWTNKDVWKYIYDNNIELPDAYMYMYQCGVAKNRLRISQFFSVYTVSSLVKMCEYYPYLFDKICAREPNAYMAMLYYDTELFRRQKKVNDSDDVNYKQKCHDILKNPGRYNVDMRKEENISVKKCVVLYGILFDRKDWKMAYQILVSGDPKCRTSRALVSNVLRDRHKFGDRVNG